MTASKGSLKERLTRCRQIKITVIGKKPEKTTPRHRGSPQSSRSCRPALTTAGCPVALSTRARAKK